MPQYGTIKRAKPRVRVLRGYDPNEPRTRTDAFPVHADNNSTSATPIKSGQVIYPFWNSASVRYEWKLGCIAGLIPAIALQDAVDEDVIEADSLVGLSCSGQFTIATGYYATAAVSYVLGTPLTYDGVTGNILDTTIDSGAPILGFVSKHRAAQDLTGFDSSALTLTVVTFDTQFIPNGTDAT